MADDDVDLSSRLSDLRTLGSLTQSLDKSAASFGKSITNAFAKGIVEGKRFDEVLRSVGRSITESLLKSALKPLQSSLSNLLGSGLKGWPAPSVDSASAARAPAPPSRPLRTEGSSHRRLISRSAAALA